MELRGRRVALDALHTQDETARSLVVDCGAHYLFSCKDNQPTLRQNIEKAVPVPPTGFSPSASDLHPSSNGGAQQGLSGKPNP
jgi:hypothetical protein